MRIFIVASGVAVVIASGVFHQSGLSHVVIGPEGGERIQKRDNRRGGNRGGKGGFNRDGRNDRGGRSQQRRSNSRPQRPAQPAAPRVLDDVSTPYGKIEKK